MNGLEMPSSDVSVVSADSGSSAGPPVPGRSGATFLANASASASDMKSGTPMGECTSAPVRSRVIISVPPEVTCSRRAGAAGVPGIVTAPGVRSMSTAPSIPSVPSRESAIPSPPSMITTWNGRPADLPGVNCDRPANSAPISVSSCGRTGDIRRTGPAASISLGCMLCGSHLIHCHHGIRSRDAHTLIRTSSGEWKIAICAIIPRSMP